MENENREWLFGKTLQGLHQVASAAGLPKYTAAQMADWLYKKGVRSIDGFTNLSVKNRALLSERFCVGSIDSTAVQQSADGTKKYLFPTTAGQSIESAYIPDKERATLCVSSQAGCRMGCRFCMTARQGFQHSLPAGEILNQVRNIPESNSLTNIVYMGMGEPLDNLPQVLDSLEVMTSEWGYGWSPTRITLSSIGVLPALPEFLERSRVHLAISLHNPFDDERRQMMPMQKAWPLAEVIGLLRKYDFSHQRRLSFEYILFEGINDTPGHAAGLASLLRGVDCRINLIRFHTIPGTEFRSCSEEKIQWFRDYLNARGLLTTIRASRGEDINAACGLLSTKEGAK